MLPKEECRSNNSYLRQHITSSQSDTKFLLFIKKMRRNSTYTKDGMIDHPSLCLKLERMGFSHQSLFNYFIILKTACPNIWQTSDALNQQMNSTLSLFIKDLKCLCQSVIAHFSIVTMRLMGVNQESISLQLVAVEMNTQRINTRDSLKKM